MFSYSTVFIRNLVAKRVILYIFSFFHFSTKSVSDVPVLVVPT